MRLNRRFRPCDVCPAKEALEAAGTIPNIDFRHAMLRATAYNSVSTLNNEPDRFMEDVDQAAQEFELPQELAAELAGCVAARLLGNCGRTGEFMVNVIDRQGRI